MIQPLRGNHLRIWIALAVLLPVLFAGALLVRRTEPPANPAMHWERYK
jgi:hypothetical protein